MKTVKVAASKEYDILIAEGLIEKAGLPKPLLVCNRMKNVKLKKGVLPAWQQMAERLDMKLLGAVPEDDSVPAAAQTGVPVVEGDSPAGAAFQRIALRLRGNDLEIMPFPRKSLFEQFRDWLKE